MNKILPFAFVLFLACGASGDEADDPHAGHDHAAESDPADEGHVHAAATADHPAGADSEGESVHVDPANVDAWGLEVGTPATTNVRAEIELPGVLTINENRTSRISSLVEGQIASLEVDVGRSVRTGQTLASLNAPEFTRAQTEFLRAYAQADLSKKDFERGIVLRQENAIEEREFLRRQSLVEQHMAELRSAEVILHAFGLGEERLRALSASIDPEAALEDHTAVESFMPIQTPISGVVLQRDAILGDHIDPEQVLFTVSDLSVLWARLDAYEQQIPYLDRNADVVIRSQLLPDLTFPGEITFIADQVDPELRTIRVRAEVPNRDGALRPNMYVQGFLRVTSPGEERIILPVDAVQLHEGHHVVFVQLPPTPGEAHVVFEMHTVEVGPTLSDGIIVLGGLTGSEQVVKVGAFTLKAEMTKGAGGHSHAH
jgi:cobalt-zinc-cadmium efflux system membrane fusion protein